MRMKRFTNKFITVLENFRNIDFFKKIKNENIKAENNIKRKEIVTSK